MTGGNNHRLDRQIETCVSMQALHSGAFLQKKKYSNFKWNFCHIPQCKSTDIYDSDVYLNFVLEEIKNDPLCAEIDLRSIGTVYGVLNMVSSLISFLCNSI